MDKQWWTDGTGRVEIQIPVEAVKACSHQGPCDADVDSWVSLIDWSMVSRADLENALKEYGAWNDLDTVDVETLQQRCLWVACGELSDSNS